MIEGTLLQWSGCLDLWKEHDLWDEHNVIGDVLDHCESAWIDKEEWDSGVPGRSGVWHVVLTPDQDQLRSEIRDRIEELIQEGG